MGLLAGVAGGASTLRNAGSIAAIVGASIAVLAFLASLVRWWLRKRRRDRFGVFFYQGNELQVRLNRSRTGGPDFARLVREMDEWFANVERLVEKNPALLAILRSDVGIALQSETHERAYRLVWLPQRIKQMEKVVGQL
jgi:hypothetical protein